MGIISKFLYKNFRENLFRNHVWRNFAITSFFEKFQNVVFFSKMLISSSSRKYLCVCEIFSTIAIFFEILIIANFFEIPYNMYSRNSLSSGLFSINFLSRSHLKFFFENTYYTGLRKNCYFMTVFRNYWHLWLGLRKIGQKCIVFEITNYVISCTSIVTFRKLCDYVISKTCFMWQCDNGF